jgi:hypothetical protein
MKYIYFKLTAMRIRIAFFTAFLIFLMPPAFSFTATNPDKVGTTLPPGPLYSLVTTLKVKDLQKLIGRKLTLKERIGLVVLKSKLKKKKADNSKMGQTAFIIGIAAVGLLIIGLFVPYVMLASLVASIFAIVFGTSAYKKNNNDRKALAGKLMGWITLGLVVIIFALAVAAIASIFN